MKLLSFSLLFLIFVLYFDYSISRPFDNIENIESVFDLYNGTAVQLTNADITLDQNFTSLPLSNPTEKTTTPINRVSNVVSIAVPAGLFGLTILVGYGLIIYAVISGGNGVPFLTRTSTQQRRLLSN